MRKPLIAMLLILTGCKELPKVDITVNTQPSPTPSALQSSTPDSSIARQHTDQVEPPLDPCGPISGPTYIREFELDGALCRIQYRPDVNRLEIYINNLLVQTYCPGMDSIVEFDFDDDDEVIDECFTTLGLSRT